MSLFTWPMFKELTFLQAHRNLITSSLSLRGHKITWLIGILKSYFFFNQILFCFLALNLPLDSDHSFSQEICIRFRDGLKNLCKTTSHFCLWVNLLTSTQSISRISSKTAWGKVICLCVGGLNKPPHLSEVHMTIAFPKLTFQYDVEYKAWF